MYSLGIIFSNDPEFASQKVNEIIDFMKTLVEGGDAVGDIAPMNYFCGFNGPVAQFFMEERELGRRC